MHKKEKLFLYIITNKENNIDKAVRKRKIKKQKATAQSPLSIGITPVAGRSGRTMMRLAALKVYFCAPFNVICISFDEFSRSPCISVSDDGIITIDTFPLGTKPSCLTILEEVLQ